MFKKILAAEDIDNIKLGVSSILKQLKIPEVVHVEYCDEAFLEFKMAIQDNGQLVHQKTDTTRVLINQKASRSYTCLKRKDRK